MSVCEKEEETMGLLKRIGASDSCGAKGESGGGRGAERKEA